MANTVISLETTLDVVSKQRELITEALGADNVYHYTYLLEYEDDMLYMGVRTSKVPPIEDVYYGSSKHTPNGKLVGKYILDTFKTRKEAVAYEVAWHSKYNVACNEKYYNKSNQKTTGFDTSGCVGSLKGVTGKNHPAFGCKRSSSTLEKMSIAMKGKNTGKRHSIGSMQGKKHKESSKILMSTSRIIYKEKYEWINTKTGKIEIGSCLDMGKKYDKYGLSGCFTKLLRYQNRSAYGWKLVTKDRNDN